MKSCEYPALYQAAEGAAASAQSAHFRTYKGFAALSIVGAGLAVYGIESALAAAIAAILFFGALLLSILIAVKRFESAWYSARAVAESVKTNAWRFMMRAEPYAGYDSDAEQRFCDTLLGILSEHRKIGADIGGLAANADQISRRMRDIRALDLAQRARFYRTYRIDEQREWYGKKASANSRAAAFWLWTLVALQAIAVALTFARVLFPKARYWPTEVFVVGAASVLGWAQMKRFRELAAAYALAAHEIGLATRGFDPSQTEENFSRFVNETENAFSREHTQWIARRE